MVKEKQDKKTRLIHICLSPAEQEEFLTLFQQTTCRSYSEFARNSILHHPLTLNYRNQSLDECMEELIQLRNELVPIRTIICQALEPKAGPHHFAANGVTALPAQTQWESLLDKINQINQKIGSIANIWLA